MSKKIRQQFSCSKMMLPEHSVHYATHKISTKKEELHRRPALDEQYQEQLQQNLSLAMMEQRLIRIKILNAEGFCTYSGIPRRINQVTGTIDLDDGGTAVKRIRASEVVSLDFSKDDQ